MSEAKHTDGPWRCEGSHIYAPDGQIIAVVFNPGYRASDYPLVANRNLMTAAPDMLASLRQLADILGPRWFLENNIAEPLSAIAKAEGRS